MKDEPILEVKNLQTHFYTDEGIVKAVNGISYTLNPGEVLGIVGESGSGKSVSSMSMLQLIPTPPGKIIDGEILFHGQDLLKMSPAEINKIRGNKISMIFQDPMTALNPFLRVSTQLEETILAHQDVTKEEAKAKAIDMLDKVGIPDAALRIHDYPHQFSGGMRQRVMIAIALTCNPEVLIADEPTTALDVTIQAQILELIQSLAKQFNTAIILITHDLGVVAGFCDKICVMYAGKIVEEGSVDEIFEAPKHPYTKGLIDSLPKLGQSKNEKLYTISGHPINLMKLPQGCPFYARCDFALDKCKQNYPPTTEVGSAHKVDCWLEANTND